MKKRYFLLIAALFSSLLLLYGCGEDEIKELTAEELIKQGWAKLEAGNNADASADFKAAMGLSADTNEAYLGLGWAGLRQSHAGLAKDAFATYLSKVTDSNDAKAGLALACHAEQEFEEAIDNASAVLSSDPTWIFSRDSRINHQDLALALAHSYYETADFSQSLAVVQQYFDPSFNPDLGTNEGRDQLAKKLQSLYTG